MKENKTMLHQLRKRRRKPQTPTVSILQNALLRQKLLDDHNLPPDTVIREIRDDEPVPDNYYVGSTRPDVAEGIWYDIDTQTVVNIRLDQPTLTVEFEVSEAPRYLVNFDTKEIVAIVVDDQKQAPTSPLWETSPLAKSSKPRPSLADLAERIRDGKSIENLFE